MVVHYTSLNDSFTNRSESFRVVQNNAACPSLSDPYYIILYYIILYYIILYYIKLNEIILQTLLDGSERTANRAPAFVKALIHLIKTFRTYIYIIIIIYTNIKMYVHCLAICKVYLMSVVFVLTII